MPLNKRQSGTSAGGKSPAKLISAQPSLGLLRINTLYKVIELLRTNKPIT